MKPPVVFVVLQTGRLANGGLRSATELMRRLKCHQPIALTNLDSPLTQAWRDDGFNVHVVPEDASVGLSRNPAGVIRSYQRFYRGLGDILSETGARVVHANDPLAFQMSLAAVKSRRVPITLNIRGTMDPDRRPPALKYRMLFAAADHVFYLSNEMASWWRAVVPNATRASSVTYSIVDRDRFFPAGVPEDGPPAVLVSGIFSPGKGQLEFIREVVPSLATAGIETWFAGDFEPSTDPYAASCATAAAPFEGHVRFLGYRDDLADLIRRSSVVAVPSRHEGLMRGMIEAMSCGRPVVSFDVCSAREILEEKSGGAGTVVGLGDYAGMTTAISRYVADRSAAAAASEAGIAAARELFEADRVVERYERVYLELGARG